MDGDDDEDPHHHSVYMYYMNVFQLRCVSYY